MCGEMSIKGDIVMFSGETVKKAVSPLFLSGQEYLEQGIAASKMERADQEL